MKIKKGYNLFFMLAILIVHTLVLSFWLEGVEVKSKKAEFKIEERSDFDILSTKSTKQRDSVKTVQPVFTSNLSSHIK